MACVSLPGAPAFNMWKKTKIVGNDGKSLNLYQKDDYTISLNINHGLQGPGQVDKHGHHWLFEVTYKNQVVGEAPSLDGAKKLAAKHMNTLDV